jgi:hypothetical protein
MILYRALGTALDWPEAKEQANLVRQWGIEVHKLQRPALRTNSAYAFDM